MWKCKIYIILETNNISNKSNYSSYTLFEIILWYIFFISDKYYIYNSMRERREIVETNKEIWMISNIAENIKDGNKRSSEKSSLSYVLLSEFCTIYKLYAFITYIFSNNFVCNTNTKL